MIEMRPLSTVAPSEVEALLDAAFGADRKARTAYKLREGVTAIDALSFAAFDGNLLVGSVQCWPVLLLEENGRSTPLTLVGPVAVRPEGQRGGTGKMLTARCLEAAAAHGHDALMMIGDPEYYGRFFGFSAKATGGWTLPGPAERRRLLALIGRQGGVPASGAILPDRGFASRGLAA